MTRTATSPGQVLSARELVGTVAAAIALLAMLHSVRSLAAVDAGMWLPSAYLALLVLVAWAAVSICYRVRWSQALAMLTLSAGLATILILAAGRSSPWVAIGLVAVSALVAPIGFASWLRKAEPADPEVPRPAEARSLSVLEALRRAKASLPPTASASHVEDARAAGCEAPRSSQSQARLSRRLVPGSTFGISKLMALVAVTAAFAALVQSVQGSSKLELGLFAAEATVLLTQLAIFLGSWLIRDPTQTRLLLVGALAAGVTALAFQGGGQVCLAIGLLLLALNARTLVALCTGNLPRANASTTEHEAEYQTRCLAQLRVLNESKRAAHPADVPASGPPDAEQCRDGSTVE